MYNQSQIPEYKKMYFHTQIKEMFPFSTSTYHMLVMPSLVFDSLLHNEYLIDLGVSNFFCFWLKH